jgi:hypothetical protein
MAKLRSEKLQDMQLWVEQIENGVCYELGTNNAEKATEKLGNLVDAAIDAWKKLDEMESCMTYNVALRKRIPPKPGASQYSLYRDILSTKELLKQAIVPLKSWRVEGLFHVEGLQEG